MKAFLFLLVVLTTTSLAQAQAHLTITQNGLQLGYATVSISLEKDGTKSVTLRMELTQQGQTVKVTSEAKYDPKGAPIRKFQQTIVTSDFTKQIVATFNQAGASITELNGDKRATRSVSLAETAPRTSASEFWFLRDKPKVNQSEDAYQFNVDSLQWDLVHTEFIGDKKVSVGGRTVVAHQVTSKRGDQVTTSYLDDRGLPVLIEKGLIKMERIWPK